MNVRRSTCWLIIALCAVLLPACDPPQNPVTTAYLPGNNLVFNPERGLYRHQGECQRHDFTDAQLASYRSEMSSLVMCIFYLPNGVDSIPGAITQFQKQADTLRRNGFKMIVRFAYGATDDDEDITRVMKHLDQLAPVLRANSDVIYLMQSGFVGAWGEGASSQNFGTEGSFTSADKANRNAIVNRLLEILPANRMVTVRTSRMKALLFGTTPSTPADVQNPNHPPVGRVGHHNDCFLASSMAKYSSSGSSDADTWKQLQGDSWTTAMQKTYVREDTKQVAMGGETCITGTAPSDRSTCPNAPAEMAEFHYSFLNKDWNPTIFSSWAGECETLIKKRLGHRLAIESFAYPAAVTRGKATTLTLTFRNDGWAAPVNVRPVWLILRNSSTGREYQIKTRVDSRLLYGGGKVTTQDPTFSIPTTVPSGDYDMLLNLPDPSPSLASRKEYSIRLASTHGSGTDVWESTTGFNDLRRTLHLQ